MTPASPTREVARADPFGHVPKRPSQAGQWNILDRLGRGESVSAVARDVGCVWVEHMTPLDNLLGILEHGALDATNAPRRKAPRYGKGYLGGGRFKTNFLQIRGVCSSDNAITYVGGATAGRKDVRFPLAILVFDLGFLDHPGRNNITCMSSGWNYGEYGGSMRDRKNLADVLWQGGGGGNNEIQCDGPVPLTRLREILVAPDQLERVRRQLGEAGIRLPPGVRLTSRPVYPPKGGVKMRVFTNSRPCQDPDYWVPRRSA